MELDENTQNDNNTIPRVTKDLSLERRLLQSAEEGNSILVFKILKTRLVNVDARDELYNTSIIKAAKGGHFEVVQMFVEAGADVNLTNSLLVTPLHLAAKYNHPEVVKLLVLAGANLNAKNKDGLKPVDFAQYKTESWEVLHDASLGEMPEIEEISEVPVIPDYAIEGGTAKKKKKGKKGGKKKGKKGGKKKGKKKKK